MDYDRGKNHNNTLCVQSTNTVKIITGAAPVLAVCLPEMVQCAAPGLGEWCS